MSDNSFKDFDAVEREEQGDRLAEFKIGGETFEADLNINAGKMLKWMRTGSRVEAIPNLLLALMDEKDVDRLIDTLERENIDFAVMEEVILWLAEQMGDSGN